METEIIRLLPQFIKDWVPAGSSIAIASGDKYVAYIPGAYDIQIIKGQRIPEGSITQYVYLQKCRVETLVDKSVFGNPYYGIGYPLDDVETGFSGALIVILPPEYFYKKQAPFSFIIGKSGGAWIPIPIEEIIYIESNQKKTFIYTEDGHFNSSYALKTIEQRLPNSFIRIHRSYIVNISYIKQISRDLSSNLMVTLKGPNCMTLTISQTYNQKVRNMLGF